MTLAWPNKHATRAVELLCQAVSKGYNDVVHMSIDTDLDPIRQRADYKKLVSELVDDARDYDGCSCAA